MELSETVTISIDEYKELIESKQKAEQYKKYMLSYSYKKPFADILLAIEQKYLFELNTENKNEEDK